MLCRVHAASLRSGRWLPIQVALNSTSKFSSRLRSRARRGNLLLMMAMTISLERTPCLEGQRISNSFLSDCPDWQLLVLSFCSNTSLLLFCTREKKNPDDAKSWKRDYWQDPVWRRLALESGEENEIVRKHKAQSSSWRGPALQPKIEHTFDQMIQRDEMKLQKKRLREKC